MLAPEKFAGQVLTAIYDHWSLQEKVRLYETMSERTPQRVN